MITKQANITRSFLLDSYLTWHQHKAALMAAVSPKWVSFLLLFLCIVLHLSAITLGDDKLDKTRFGDDNCGFGRRGCGGGRGGGRGGGGG